MMNRFACDGFQAIYADGPTEAAKLFAERAARQSYGVKGYCRTLFCDGSRDGSTYEFRAFIGRNTLDGCTGHDVWLLITRQER